MNSHFVTFYLISIVLTFNIQLHLCIEKGSTPTRRQSLALPRVSCSQRGIKAVFGSQVIDNIRVKDKTGATFTVPKSESLCGVKMARHNQSLIFISTYDSCYAQLKDNKVVIPLQVQLRGDDRLFNVNISCPLTRRPKGSPPLPPKKFHGECAIHKDLQVKCGHQRVSPDSCADYGCCYNSADATCYYRLNSCSLDGHFVFAVEATAMDLPMRPRRLRVKNQPQCIPVIATPHASVFKIHVMDCGVKAKVNGDVVVYELEVEELPEPRRTNQSSFNLQVDCEYEASVAKSAVYLHSFNKVTNPPPVVGLGTINVQMRIATDASFTCFIPEDQLPLALPLREAVYVEISIAQPTPDSTLSLHVRDCFAYPSSRHSVWTLLYDGCPNHLDESRGSVPVDNQGKTHSRSQVRRFDVKTFAFFKKGQLSVEEIYFYCWVEICTQDVDCTQRCAIVSSEGERLRREASSEMHPTQLVSLGPLLLRQNSTKITSGPCVQQNSVCTDTVYVLAGMGAMTTLLLLAVVVISCLSNRKCPKQRATQVSDAQVEDVIS
ncbi:zona pellucida sperm-binding protein 4-like [Syngnathus typhle]|uniref:zona pellucida sperm-binding protein 4-like n=1 Tax=Syngnathus typhle TaxID=161592 RepID=UPI002A69B01D|nr:zona pellucida sperm-binding protein 4-like [Syngnathus typhle]